MNLSYGSEWRPYTPCTQLILNEDIIKKFESEPEEKAIETTGDVKVFISIPKENAGDPQVVAWHSPSPKPDDEAFWNIGLFGVSLGDLEIENPLPEMPGLYVFHGKVTQIDTEGSSDMKYEGKYLLMDSAELAWFY